MNPSSLLKIEKKYISIFLLALFVGSFSGYATHVFSGLSVWQQLFYLTHVVSGLALIFIIIPYPILHFRRTLGSKRALVVISGWSLLIGFYFLAISGLYIIFFGIHETTRWIFEYHIYSSYLTIIFLTVHLVLHRYSKTKRAKQLDNVFITFNKVKMISALKGASIIFGAVALSAIIYQAQNEDYKTTSLIEPYEYSYGDHPFRPSQTDIKGAKFIDERLIGNSDSCAACHVQIYKEWQASMHSQAASDVTYIKNINLLSEQKGIAATRYCEGCHAPVALLSGQLSEGGKHGGISNTVAHREGVSCTTCHGINKATHLKGVASYEFEPTDDYLFANRNNIFLKKIHNFLIRIHPQQHRETMSREFLQKPELCATCHVQFMDKDLNNWGWIKMQDEYSAWLQSHYSGQTEHELSRQEILTCQNCHMPKSKGIDPSSDKNNMIISHRSLGANTAIPFLNSDTQQLLLTKKFLQSGRITVDIKEPWRTDAIHTEQYIEESLRPTQKQPYYFYLGETAKIKLSVSNNLVGHDFPGGTTDINEVWIHFITSDAENNILYESGALMEDNYVDKNSYFYRSIPIDRFGKHVWKHDLFNMVGDSFKNVIPAGGSDVVEYSFKIPYWAKSPIIVSASVRYRKLNQRYASWVLEDKMVSLPITEMARDSITIPIRIRPKVNN